MGDNKILMLPDLQHLWCTNWSEWKERILTIVELHNVSGHLDGTMLISQPVAAGTPTPVEITLITAWQASDRLAKALIILNVADFDATGIEARLKMVQEVWTVLRSIWELQGILEKMNALANLETYQLQAGNDLEMHWDEMRCRLKQARAAGCTITGPEFSIIICNSMPISYQPYTAHLLLEPDPDIVMSSITAIKANQQLLVGIVTSPGTITTSGTAAEPGQTSAFIATGGGGRSAVECKWCG